MQPIGKTELIRAAVNSTPKIVRCWHMLAHGESSQALDDEVDQVLWLPIDKAIDRLKYPLEKSLLEQANQPHVLTTGSQKKRWHLLPERLSLRRLGNTIETFEPELQALIEETVPNDGSYPSWYRKSKQLLKAAKQAPSFLLWPFQFFCCRAFSIYLIRASAFSWP